MEGRRSLVEKMWAAFEEHEWNKENIIKNFEDKIGSIWRSTRQVGQEHWQISRYEKIQLEWEQGKGLETKCFWVIYDLQRIENHGIWLVPKLMLGENTNQIPTQELQDKVKKLLEFYCEWIWNKFKLPVNMESKLKTGWIGYAKIWLEEKAHFNIQRILKETPEITEEMIQKMEDPMERLKIKSIIYKFEYSY